MYRTQGKLPDRIQNAPRILPGLQLYLTAFFTLDRERAVGFNGRERIMRRAIIAYAEDYEFPEEQRSLLTELIPRMDDAFLQRLEEKRPKPTK